MKLIDILVRELPGKGGWPSDADTCGYGRFDGETKVYFAKGRLGWTGDFSPSIFCVDGASLDCVWIGAGVEIIEKPEEKSIITKQEYEAALAAFKQPAWKGVGFPPPGTECEYAFIASYRKQFSRGKVLAYSASNVFMQDWVSKNEFIRPLDKIKFLPILTESERQRDEFTAACIGLDNSQDWSHSMAYFDGLYQAIAQGKIPGVKLTD